MASNNFLDGCHRYGWIINILATLFLAGTIWGSLQASVGDIKASQEDLKGRVERIENILLCGKIACR